LGDKDILKIIDSVLFKPKSLADISKDTEIPPTTVFRKTKWMLEKRLLVVEKIIITRDGKKTSLFRSLWKSISAKYEYSSMHVEIQKNIEQAEIITKKMFSIDTGSEEQGT